MVGLSLRRRPVDLVLVACFCSFALTSFIFDPYTALDVDLASSTSIPGRLNYWFASSVDPLLLDPPLFVRIMVGLSVVLLGPMYLVIAYGIWRQRDWVRVPSLAYAAVKLYSMVVYLGVALFGDTSPRDHFLFWAVYLPYLIAPLVLAARMIRPDPFSSGGTEGAGGQP